MKPHNTTLVGVFFTTIASAVLGALPLAPDDLSLLTWKQVASFICGLTLALVAAIAAWRSQPQGKDKA